MSKKILVVDDTKNIRTLLTTCLEIEGYTVLSAHNGVQALKLFQTESPDLAFLDIKLPELSGTEVLRKIREKGIRTPVIIMTAFATVKNAVECTKLGAVAYLQKPFTAEKVRNVLLEILSNYQGNLPNADNWVNLAEELMAGGKLDDAYHLLKQALAVDPARGKVYHLMARILEAQGNHKEAARFYTIASQFDSP
jgi:two-component system, OmpR family, response regulator